MDAPTKDGRPYGSYGDDPPQQPGTKRAVVTEIEIRETIAVLREALERKSPRRPNIWAFYSNKNNQLVTVEGDLNFIQCILLEGDSTVDNYRVVPSPRGPSTDLILVTWRSVATIILDCAQRHGDSGHGREAALGSPSGTRASPERLKVTERDLSQRMVEFANWLLLNGAITRAREFSTAAEADLLLGFLENNPNPTIGGAMRLPDADPALMLAAIAKGLANGALKCELTQQLLSLDRPVGHIEVRSNAACSDWPSIESVLPASLAPTMPRNRRTNAHPELFTYPDRWLKYVEPELAQNELQRRRALAVRLYIQNRSYAEILNETGVSESWVRKLFRRTLATDRDGSPLGLQALVRYRHLTPYTRTSILPDGNLAEGRRGGYAGAFTTLAVRYADGLLNLIEDEVLKKRRNSESKKLKIPEARVSWVDLHGRILAFLKGKGVGSDDYPFNTRDQAYSSIVSLCNAILFKRPIRWIESRGGVEAGRRTRMGSGLSSLVTAQWVSQIHELDYQKTDSSAIVEISTPKNTTIDVPVSRWWAGTMVEAYSEAVVATSDSFEPQTTEDCLMELVDSAVVPPPRLDRLKGFGNCPDGGWLPSHCIPELAGQAWDILKLDQAWAHKSTTALSAIIATVGCAICYGPSRAWYARHLVERTQEKLTQAGPQKLPTTLGSEPRDTRKNNPDQQALDWHIRQDDICDLIKSSARWLNEIGDEGVYWASPLMTLKASIEDPRQRFFPRPFPRPRQEDRPLMWHMIPCRVEGNARDGVTPCVRSQRTRFRGPALVNAWSLIGREGYLQVYRRDMRISRLLLVNPTEVVGRLTPEKKWMSMAVSWRDHCLIQKFGRINKRHTRSFPPVASFLATKAEELIASQSGRAKSTKRKRSATTVARIRRNAQLHPDEIAYELEPPLTGPVGRSSDTAGVLGPAPEIGPLRRARDSR